MASTTFNWAGPPGNDTPTLPSAPGQASRSPQRDVPTLRRALYLLITLASLNRCTYATDAGQNEDSLTGSLRLLQSSPTPGQEQVKRETVVTLFFNEPLAVETVALTEFRLFSGLVEQSGTLKVHLLDKSVTLSPAKALQENLRYQVYVSNQLQSLSGRTLEEAVIFDFSTGSELKSQELPSANTPTARTIQPIWSKSCLTGCHAPPHPRAAVDLSSPDLTRHTLLGTPSTQWPMQRLLPGDHARSYLMRKLIGAGGYVGLPMPPDNPLGEEELRQIARWIDGGALP